jgi:hypothetical protein
MGPAIVAGVGIICAALAGLCISVAMGVTVVAYKIIKSCCG